MSVRGHSVYQPTDTIPMGKRNPPCGYPLSKRLLDAVTDEDGQEYKDALIDQYNEAVEEFKEKLADAIVDCLRMDVPTRGIICWRNPSAAGKSAIVRRQKYGKCYWELELVD